MAEQLQKLLFAKTEQWHRFSRRQHKIGTCMQGRARVKNLSLFAQSRVMMEWDKQGGCYLVKEGWTP